ncbi:16S rRNA (cytidine(1402)-2'-O)-methyltransferase [uncultured Clostridium sp.]|jgi:16S rRNA (cytidine1402-2'-O)-methyltransferase|uniref:16S rRNA (cytidine(1402)-2'-O)-methyltransferase n=1 Tax=uncultured Clostridium sp. TaxID=59620 RepID=UPI002605B6A0|nr:16S rRNA (cytidine(1402)-2'-O)-methyltransferase [uncultured Clostridium sp.]
MTGTIYLVPTPIGNLGDITLRALETLKKVDIVAAEDTRQSLKLLNHFEIKKPLISYHMHNEQGKGNELIERAKRGESIAVVSDAGTPGVSDPGEVIVKKCIEHGIHFEVLPGATAFTTALVYSGLDTSKFMFKGFFPRENKDRKVFLADIESRTETIMVYESPYRVIESLSVMKEGLGNRNVAVCRELTKLYESIYRGTFEEAIAFFVENAPRGEFVIVIEGKTKEAIEQEEKAKWEHMTIEEHIISYIEAGEKKKDAIKSVAKERSMAKSDVYKYSLDL